MVFYTAGSVETPFARIVSETEFPREGTVKLSVQNPKQKRFALQLRVPNWTRSFAATIGKQRLTGIPGAFLTIDRNWKSGDTVAIEMEMTVRVLPGGKSYPDSAAIQRGPQVLAAEESLNAGASPAVAKMVALKAVAAPAGWSGGQVYEVENGGKLTLVPFADAIQMRVWLPRR